MYLCTCILFSHRSTALTKAALFRRVHHQHCAWNVETRAWNLASDRQGPLSRFSLGPLTTNRTCRNYGHCVSVPSPSFGCQNPLVRATNYCDQLCLSVPVFSVPSPSFGCQNPLIRETNYCDQLCLSVPVFRSQTVSWNTVLQPPRLLCSLHDWRVDVRMFCHPI